MLIVASVCGSSSPRISWRKKTIPAVSPRYVVEYLVTNDSRVVNIIGIGDRGNGSNIKALKNALKKEYGIELRYTDFN